MQQMLVFWLKMRFCSSEFNILIYYMQIFGNIIALNTLSVTYERFNKWAANETYGEMIEAIATDRVDFGLVFYLLTIEREKYFSPITQLTEFR